MRSDAASQCVAHDSHALGGLSTPWRRWTSEEEIRLSFRSIVWHRAQITIVTAFVNNQGLPTFPTEYLHRATLFPIVSAL